LRRPFFDISTKLEATDRYISWDEAKEMSGLTDLEISEMKEILSTINDLITKIAQHVHLQNEDRKVEFAFNERRELVVVDVIGTLNECRFTWCGMHVSKEVLREFYKKHPGLAIFQRQRSHREREG
jgi:phosphoribosylaminoimidazole-succinocarboxamide synthase